MTFFAIRTYAFGSYLFFAEFKRSLITLFLNLLLTNSLSFVVSKAFNASFADSLRSILFSDVSLTDSDSSTSTKTIFSRLLVEFSQSSIIFNKYLGR